MAIDPNPNCAVDPSSFTLKRGGGENRRPGAPFVRFSGSFAAALDKPAAIALGTAQIFGREL